MEPNQDQNSNQTPSSPQEPQASQPPYSQQTYQGAPSKTNGLAITGFVLAFLLQLIGLILSIIGLVKAKNYGGNGQGLAIAGIVISVILLPISFLFTLGFISGIQQAAQEKSGTSSEVQDL